jgi:hypothetical protein
MKILIVSQHFPPEKGAVRRIFEFARYFIRRGHDVSVLTAMPNYPDGIVPPEYRGRFYINEKIDGVNVHRSYVLPAANRHPRRRMIGFIVFLITALINSVRIRDDFDVVLATAPPVTTPVIGWVLSKFYRSKFIVEIRDLQPESSEDFGNLNRSIFTRALKKLMHTLYRKADRVVAVTDGINEYLETIGVSKDRVTTIKSGVSDEFINADSNGIRNNFGWEEKFLVLYAGTLGWAHSLETIIEAARKLTDQRDVQFVFVGDGQKREALEGMVRDYGLRNVEFTGSQPLEVIPYFLKASDVLVESLKEVPITKSTFPCKLFEYMASGRPIVFGAREGEAITELEKAGGALSFPTDDATRLSELIMSLKTGRIDGDKLGRLYRQHATKFHRREIWAERYASFIETV